MISFGSEFAGKRVVVTGAAGVMGRALVDAFAQQGADICATDHTTDMLSGFCVAADLTTDDGLNTLLDTVQEKWGAPDIVVNNAALYPSSFLLDLATADWDRIMDVNVRAPFVLMRGFALHMIDQNVQGSFINISSGAARKMRRAAVTYCMSKTALDRMSKGFALELAEYGIRVNCLEPGFASGSSVSSLSQEHIDRVMAAIPLGTETGPEPYRAAACFTVDVDATAPYLWQHRNGLPDTLAALEHRRYGMRRGLARIVVMLERTGITGTFFVPGIVAEEHPDLLPGLLERGQEIGLHGYVHERVEDISDRQFTDALERSLNLFEVQTGQRPSGFRSPAWEMTPHMLAELSRLDLWDSSLMGEDVPYTIAGIPELPVRWDNDDAVFSKFLGPGDRTPRPDYQISRQWLEDAQSQIKEGGLYMLTVHDWISGRANRVAQLEHLLSTLSAQPEVWLASCDALAQHHKMQKGGMRVKAGQLKPFTSKGNR